MKIQVSYTAVFVFPPNGLDGRISLCWYNREWRYASPFPHWWRCNCDSLRGIWRLNHQPQARRSFLQYSRADRIGLVIFVRAIIRELNGVCKFRSTIDTLSWSYRPSGFTMVVYVAPSTGHVIQGSGWCRANAPALLWFVYSISSVYARPGYFDNALGSV